MDALIADKAPAATRKQAIDIRRHFWRRSGSGTEGGGWRGKSGAVAIDGRVIGLGTITGSAGYQSVSHATGTSFLNGPSSPPHLGRSFGKRLSDKRHPVAFRLCQT
jgi:hypothetical protein